MGLEPLKVCTLLCTKDVDLYINTMRFFNYYYGNDYIALVHEDGSLTEKDVYKLKKHVNSLKIIYRKDADERIGEYLNNHPNCNFFRKAEHHTIFRMKLFDPIFLNGQNNILLMDSDILFCKRPTKLIEFVNNKVGTYLLDTWTSYCLPFRDEDNDMVMIKKINAGLIYYPTISHFNLDLVEECLDIMFIAGKDRNLTHPFFEQTCHAYNISKNINLFNQLPHPDYCVVAYHEPLLNHGHTALHVNNNPYAKTHKEVYYMHELNKINNT